MDWWIPIVSTCVGALLGAIVTLYVQKNVATHQDSLARHRDRHLDEARHSRAALLERAAEQRRVLVEVRRLSADAAHSLRDEAAFGALRVLITRAFGHPGFADRVCGALDEAAEAAAGTPGENAGLSLVACTDVMQQIIRQTDAAANVNVPEFEDPMSLFDKELVKQREAFGNLWPTSDPPGDT